mmetsp:Transcript_20644/g.57866  ORF Transcript_20644/g.57866 Transcript_20644/m.57866 type:complete len:461 (+) Transcript_20644:639-2021(+)
MAEVEGDALRVVEALPLAVRHAGDVSVVPSGGQRGLVAAGGVNQQVEVRGLEEEVADAPALDAAVPARVRAAVVAGGPLGPGRTPALPSVGVALRRPEALPRVAVACLVRAEVYGVAAAKPLDAPAGGEPPGRARAGRALRQAVEDAVARRGVAAAGQPRRRVEARVVREADHLVAHAHVHDAVARALEAGVVVCVVEPVVAGLAVLLDIVVALAVARRAAAGGLARVVVWAGHFPHGANVDGAVLVETALGAEPMALAGLRYEVAAVLHPARARYRPLEDGHAAAGVRGVEGAAPPEAVAALVVVPADRVASDRGRRRTVHDLVDAGGGAAALLEDLLHRRAVVDGGGPGHPGLHVEQALVVHALGNVRAVPAGAPAVVLCRVQPPLAARLADLEVLQLAAGPEGLAPKLVAAAPGCPHARHVLGRVLRPAAGGAQADQGSDDPPRHGGKPAPRALDLA